MSAKEQQVGSGSASVSRSGRGGSRARRGALDGVPHVSVLVPESPEGELSYLELGRVATAHGVRGALKVKLHDPNSITVDAVAPERLRLASRGGVRVLHRKGGTLIVAVAGVVDREAALALRGQALLAPRSAVVLNADEYLCDQLVGCDAVEGERSYGRVREVFCAGASDILVVDDGECERLIPFVEPWVVAVDLERRLIELYEAEVWDAQPLNPS